MEGSNKFQVRRNLFSLLVTANKSVTIAILLRDLYFSNKSNLHNSRCSFNEITDINRKALDYSSLLHTSFIYLFRDKKAIICIKLYRKNLILTLFKLKTRWYVKLKTDENKKTV